MTTTRASEPTTYPWSSTDEADRFAVEDPVSTIIELAHRHSSDPRHPVLLARADTWSPGVILQH